MNYLNNYCAITEVKPGYFHQTRVAATTFIKNNPWFDGILVILTTNLDQITVEERAQLDQIYDKIDIVEVDISKLKELATKIKTSKREFNSIFDYFFTYAFGIKSKGNLYFKSSVIFNKTAVSFLEKDKTSFAIGEGRIPMGSGTSINHAMFYIPGEFTSDSLQESVIKHLKLSNNIYYKSAPSSAIQAALEDHRIPINRLPMINLVDSSNFPNTKYREFLRYNKGIVAINMNTTWVNDNRFAKINLYWQYANQLSLKYRPSATKISKKAALDLEIKKQKRYEANQKISKTFPNFNRKSRLIQLDIDNPSIEVSQEVLSSNIALYTVCNNEFIDGAKVMIYSFLKNNHWFRGDIVILYNDRYSNLSLENIKILTSLYDKIKFVQVDESPYINLINKFKKTASSSQLRFIPSLFTFEIFKEVSKYDHLLYLDSDMLIRSDLSDLFKFDHDMIVTPDAGEYNSSDLINTFNGGFMLLANKISSNNYRDKLISHAMGMYNMSLADQTIMNSFFNGKLYSAGINYNCLKRCFPDKKFNSFNSNIKIVHYVGAKPWHENKTGIEANYKNIESIWKNELNLVEKTNVLNKTKTFVKKKVVIVGNSPNVLKYNVGNKIDEFDCVIRVNNFKIEGFENKVGTKVDYWLTSFSPAINKRSVDLFKGIFTVNSNWKEEEFKKRIKRIVPLNQTKKVYILSQSKLYDLKRKIGYNTGEKWPTSGIVAIYTAMDIFKDYEIYIHGFSFFKESGKYASHYWNETKAEEFKKHHDHDLEEKYVNMLIQEGKLKKLI